jgi:hypothetical protein
MMKRRRARTMMAAAVLLFYTSPIIATIYFADGGIHNIDYVVYPDNILVDYEWPGPQTTVNVLDDAYVEGIESYGNSIINVYGGLVQVIFSWDNSQVNVYDGSLSGAAARGNSQINIYAGDVYVLFAVEKGQLDIFGGMSLEELVVVENGIAMVHGCDFAVDGTPVGYVELSSVINQISGQLTGTLLSGDPLNVLCEINDDGQIFLVPEPATILLLGLGGLVFLRRRIAS